MSVPGAAKGSPVRVATAAIVGLAAAALVVGFGPQLIAASGVIGADGVYGETVFTLAIFVPLLVMAIVGGRLTGIATLNLGARPGARLAQGAAIGFGGLLLAIGYAAIAGTLVRGAGTTLSVVSLGLGALVVLVQVTAEEVYFRGWLQPLVATAWGMRIAVPVVAIGFALLHVAGGLRGPIELLNLLLGGLLFGLLTARGGGLAGAIGAHLAWNGAEQLGFGLDPNPGIGGYGALVDYDLVGKALWGGSDAGLNASVAMTISLLALLVPLVLLSRRRPTQS
ncbi:hypothetical protein C8J43_103554 [Sphingomonas sp. PP-CE-1G-424]|nr:hypothetical protein C8J43_103554 [Sphingomonas sp. PP-CE-1G-424]